VKIEEHISELLFEHDCVIVPDFGGFVCNYAPARIDPVKHLFEPPGKRILFNKGLTRNDGLLAHHISGKLKLPYSEALTTISKEVQRYKEDIEKDKRLTLDNIGQLYVDEKGSLIFQQDNRLNYLTESFGLSAFYHLPAEAEKAADEAKVIPIYNERKKARVYAAAAVVAALVVSAFCFTMLEKQTNMRFSSFNFFSKKDVPLYSYTPGKYKELPKPVFESFHVVVTDANGPTPTAISVTVPANANNAIVKPSPVTNNAVPVVSSSKFLIIVGSFSIKEHAENLINELNRQNLHVSIVGRNPAGLYMVGYGNFQSHDAATAERVNFMKKFNKDAWIKAN
jgi:hypothetical protein